MMQLYTSYVLTVLFAIISRGGNFMKAEEESLEFIQSRALVESTNNFAFSVFRTIQKHEEYFSQNIFFSPTSLFFALGMTHLGSRERSSAQLLKALHWNDFDAVVMHDSVIPFHDMLHKVSGVELRIANKMWIHKNVDVLDSFKQGTAKLYKAEVAKADFARNPENSRQEINKWVYEQTARQIEELLPTGVISHMTQMALINAVYFKGTWETEFDKQRTFPADFYPMISRSMEVQMMARKGRMKYYLDEELDCQIVELPYSGKKYSMFVFLPNEKDGLNKLEKNLGTEVFKNVLGNLHSTVVEVHLPRFKLSQQFRMNDVLARLGVTDLFDSTQADLSGITGSKDLFVSHIIHKAQLNVHEEGTEAAAGTGVIMNKRSLDMHPIMHIDHPFLLFIQHIQSNTILFAGRVVQPESSQFINTTKNTEL